LPETNALAYLVSWPGTKKKKVVMALTPEDGGHGEHRGEEPDERDEDGVRPWPVETVGIC